MNIDLHPRVEQSLGESVRRGDYANVSAAVTEALTLLEKRDHLARSGPAGLLTPAGVLDGDIMALAFIVMMEAAKSAREDLKAIMDQVKAINAAKGAMRDLMQKVRRDIVENLGRTTVEFAGTGLGSEANYHKIPVPHPDPESPGGIRRVPTDVLDARLTRVEDIKAVEEALAGKLDSLSEMGEMESLRLQMAMDRMSKMMSTLSNMLTKMSETSQAIVGNLK